MYKTILVPVEGIKRSKPAQAAALNIGKDFSSHIVGLRVVPTIQSLQSITEHHYLSYEVYVQILKNQKEQVKEDKNAFVEYFDRAGIDYEWIEEEGDFLDYMKLYARTADLAIVPQGNDDLGDIMGDIPSFILDSGIPTLAVPKKARSDTFGDNIFIAWNGGKESIRAVHAALPLLKKAKNVTILSICEEKKDEVKTADICKNLARHGVLVRGMTEGLHFDPGAKFLEICLSENADLIVAGAWAHSRFTELIYGGVTKTLFNNQQIPVLFTH